LKNDTWQGYYRHISTKLVILKLFDSLRGYSSSVGSSWDYLQNC
jgi:hypothetical protein